MKNYLFEAALLLVILVATVVVPVNGSRGDTRSLRSKHSDNNLVHTASAASRASLHVATAGEYNAIITVASFNNMINKKQ